MDTEDVVFSEVEEILAANSTDTAKISDTKSTGLGWKNLNFRGEEGFAAEEGRLVIRSPSPKEARVAFWAQMSTRTEDMGRGGGLCGEAEEAEAIFQEVVEEAGS